MNVVVPYTSLSLETADALAAASATVELVDVSGSLTDYWDLLDRLWAAGQTFAIVEQDIVVRPGTLASFETCGSAWCAAPYPYLGSGTYTGLGCSRFRAELMQEVPDLMDRVALHHYDGHSLKHWCVLDAAMQRELWKHGRQVCVTGHHPVGHLHDWPSHGCVPRGAS